METTLGLGAGRAGCAGGGAKGAAGEAEFDQCRIQNLAGIVAGEWPAGAIGAMPPNGGVHGGRGDGGDGDARRMRLQAQAAIERHNGVLGADVGAHIGHGHQAQDGGDVDQLAAPARAE